MAADLTELGDEVLQVGMDNWYRANAEYPKYLKSGVTVTPLENALKKVLA